MTEKRFMIDNESDIIEFNYNTNEYIQDFMWADGKSWDRICNRLNELFDENEQLKSQLTSISQLIDNKIDEFKNGDYGDLPCNTIHMFLDLKQEMEDLR